MTLCSPAERAVFARRASHPGRLATGGGSVLSLRLSELGRALHGQLLLGLVGGLVATAHAGTVVVAVADAAGQPLTDAVVFLDSAEARKQVKPLIGAEMAQEKRKFVPSVLVVPVGTEVRFPNHDSVRHHVYSFSPAKKFELKLYSGTPSNPVLFDKPGVVVLGCNIHDQMVGWMLVVETPFYGRTPDGSGKVQLDNVPPGVYTLRTWHARLPVGAPAQEQVLTGPQSVQYRRRCVWLGCSPDASTPGAPQPDPAHGGAVPVAAPHRAGRGVYGGAFVH